MINRSSSGQEASLWQREHSNHCFLIFLGLPFLAVGLYGVFGPLFVLFTAGIEDNAPWFVLPFSLPFLAFGIWAIFGGNGLEIDQKTASVMTWTGLRVRFWSMRVPMRTHHWRLSQFKQVTVKEVIRGGPQRARRYFQVSLDGKEEELSVALISKHAYNHARELAEELARFCKLDIADHTGGDITVRSHDRLDESLRDRTRRLGEKLPRLDSPLQESHFKLQTSDSQIVCEMALPWRGLSSRATIAFSFVLGLISAKVFSSQTNHGSREALFYFIVGRSSPTACCERSTGWRLNSASQGTCTSSQRQIS